MPYIKPENRTPCPYCKESTMHKTTEKQAECKRKNSRNRWSNVIKNNDKAGLSHPAFGFVSERKDEIHSIRTEEELDEICDHLENLGISYRTGDDLPFDFYHQTNKILPQPGEIRDVDDKEGIKYLETHKPGNDCLWLSPGVSASSGRVVTEWQRWNGNEHRFLYDFDNDINENSPLPSEGFSSVSNKAYKAQFADDAVIISLDDKKYKELLDQGYAYSEEEMREFLDDEDMEYLEERRVKRNKDIRRLNWKKLKDAGVDAVRIDGLRNRGEYTSLWDMDSMVLLNGKSIVGWEEKQSAITYGELDSTRLDSEQWK